VKVWLERTYRKLKFKILSNKSLSERLKDVIIDHIHIMGFEKVHKREQIGTDGHKVWYGPRESKFIEIYDNDKRVDFTRSLQLRLFHRSIEVSPESLNECLTELINKGYIVEGFPMHWSFALTGKGVFHYSNGRSFEDNLKKNRLSRIALWISIPAVIVAIIGLLKAFELFPFS
jgi:hypothetical protein